MDIERERKDSIEHPTEENLAEYLFRFSDVLAAGKWALNRTNEIELTRSIIEQLDYDDEVKIGEPFENSASEVDPIVTRTIIGIRGVKRLIDIEDHAVYEPFYYLTSTTAQEVTKDEIPKEVLEEIFADAEDETSGLHELYGETFGDEGSLSEDNLDDFTINRVQEVRYQINHRGEIVQYDLELFYDIDEEVVYQNSYSTTDFENDWIQTVPEQNDVDEKKPVVVPVISEQEIIDDLKRFEAALQEFRIDEELKGNIELVGQSHEEHRKRILAMTALLSSGFIN